MKYLSIMIFAMFSIWSCNSGGGEAGTATGGKTAKKGKKGNMVLISTNMGDIKVKLYDETPKHKENFLKIVNDGTLDGTLFHRVIQNFMIQGGDPDSKDAKPGQRLGMGSLGYRVDAEFNTKFIHKKGALAAARDNNPAKASSSCQFYVVQGKVSSDAELSALEARKGFKYTDEQKEIYKTIGGTPFLDQDYTVFGEVVEGMDVLDKISQVPTDGANRPTEDVKMNVKVL